MWLLHVTGRPYGNGFVRRYFVWFFELTRTKKNLTFKQTVDNIDHTPHVVTLLIEASLFGLFTAMVLYDQVYAIIDDEVKFWSFNFCYN